MKKTRLIFLLLLCVSLFIFSCQKDSSEPNEGILCINEVYTWSPQKEFEDLDYIELYNGTNQAIDLSGSKLWESGGRDELFTLPAASVIGSKEFLLIECDKEELHADPVKYPVWGLSKGPDEYVVFADKNMKIIDSIACPSLKEFESYGRKTDGDSEWMIFAQYTKDAPNTGVARQPVTNTLGLHINEVFTNNQDVQTKPWDDTKDFIELYNRSFGYLELSGYRMNDDAKKPEKEFTFPPGTIMPPLSFMVFEVYKEDPQPQGVPIFGLGKGGDWVFVFNIEGDLIAELEIPAFEDDQIASCGRKYDGGSEIVIFSEVSKGESNIGHN